MNITIDPIVQTKALADMRNAWERTAVARAANLYNAKKPVQAFFQVLEDDLKETPSRVSVWVLMYILPGIRSFMRFKADNGDRFFQSLRQFAKNTETLTAKMAVEAIQQYDEYCLRGQAYTATVEIDGTVLFEAFQRATAQGLIRRRMTIGDWQFKGAKMTDAISVSYQGDYKLSIRSPKFITRPSPTFSEEAIYELKAIVADPLKHAQVHGHQTGNCAICTRLLTDPISVQRGIGPVCATRFFGTGAFRIS